MKAALGGFIAAAVLGLGAVSASAAPDPGIGTPGSPIGGTGLNNPFPAANNPFYFLAPAQVKDGAQTANVPTLAWVGEDVRLVACDDNILPVPFDGQFQQAEWNTGLWTGDQATAGTPTFDGSSATNLFITDQGAAYFFFPNGSDNSEKGCVSANISSLHPGLDEVTLNVYDESAGAQAASVNDPRSSSGPVFSEQFNVIWMTANAPKLSEASLSSIENPTQADGTPSTAAFPDTSTVNVGGTTDPHTGVTTGGTNYTAAGQLSAQGVANANGFLGDVAVLNQFGLDAWGHDEPFNLSDFYGGANFTPKDNNGLIQVRVTGSFPIEDLGSDPTNCNYFLPVTGGCGTNGNPAGYATITLPNQWSALANLMAASSVQYAANEGAGQGVPNNFVNEGGSLWDIHGGPTNALTHAGSSNGVCAGDGTTFLASTDAVDDCVTANGGDAFAFSRVFGDVTQFGTVGPYDPLAANASLLSDGRLNSDDAPMPALPVTLKIGAGGVGGLYGVSKYLVYSHDFNGSFLNPQSEALTTKGLGNYYNPFYQEYIPSTNRPINEASGVDGVYRDGDTATSGDDFPGFSLGHNDGDPYTFWKALDVGTNDTPGSNGCLRAAPINDPADAVTPYDYYQLPFYPTQLTVYTDERGEAYADYNPGDGFGTPPIPGLGTTENNGACDLQGLLGKPIGTAAITAQTQYPYESAPFTPPAGANTITKTVVSQWSKTLAAYPKNNLSGGAGGANVSIVVATATDVNGQPFVGETVCFSTSAGALSFEDKPSIVTPAGTTISLAGSLPTGVPEVYNPITKTRAPVVGDGYLCGTTGYNGTVAVEVAGSGGIAADVIADFVNEHLFRDVMINSLGQTGTATSTTPPTVIPADQVVLAAGTTTTNGVSTTVSPVQGGQQVALTPLPIVGTAASCKVASIHMFAKKGYARVRLSCTGTKTDSVMVRAYKGHKLVRTYKVKLTAGKNVRIRFAKGHHITVSPS